MGMPKALKHYVNSKLGIITGCIDLAKVATTQEERDKRLDQAKEQLQQLAALLNDHVAPSDRKREQ